MSAAIQTCSQKHARSLVVKPYIRRAEGHTGVTIGLAS